LSTVQSEIVRRTAAIALDAPRRRGELDLPRELAARIDQSEQRALDLAAASGSSDDGRRDAALEFLAETLTALLSEHPITPEAARGMVAEVAAATHSSARATTLAVFLRAMRTREVAQLPPQFAVDVLVGLFAMLGPVEAVSLWTTVSPTRVTCLAGGGSAPRTRRLRAAARSILACEDIASPHVRGVAVQRWDMPFAALVARTHPDGAEDISLYLRELAASLSPFFERDMLFERNSAREQSLVSAGERRLVRLGFDLHDGPLQELVAFAADLRFTREQITAIIDEPERSLVRGRFDDLGAMLESLDRSLREIAHSVRSTSAVEQPLEHAIRNELTALARTTEIQTDLAVDGDLSMLTPSQRIALFRVAQESICNIRKHSGATQVSIRLRSVASYVTLTIVDNGRGFEVERARAKGRLGLAGIVERIQLLGGDVEVDANLGAGVRVKATLPRWSPPAVETATPLYSVTA
jgi:signal transduction histidine kinase